ncbi:hypothetical protein M9Y10_015310 [Tritrichomonas musculus]|uniref:Uncharacterized protein n=1 Tax=Tritrichomonas musculus TaxID=1915356 RepID=A0ABR2L2W6_9EUKA
MCKFNKNKGDASVKIETEFDDETKRNIKSVDLNNVRKITSILITKCDLKIRKDEKSSITLFNATDQTEIEVNDCVFTGKIASDSHHIDGKILVRINQN